eukprot:CAMPEP_0197689790 /NCGR_PEP_ID=MMETSP1338-20131121/107391_1 /TAXON_ID=43686 ORGANISM="Pelagodinium beii, Strain RCC1491" /NCGR_SAMPLE_ID=MMETSP1338 /ASSEMBLY_ACC=CAM_ASM_000754 /LENGTH=67 /DNA_ID=CAMNT_0043272169 /DNA_START=41 /DNA_END=245 /DNA_ORIENTATION=+
MIAKVVTVAAGLAAGDVGMPRMRLIKRAMRMKDVQSLGPIDFLDGDEEAEARQKTDHAHVCTVPPVC